jgi:hypothetical protein
VFKEDTNSRVHADVVRLLIEQAPQPGESL